MDNASRRERESPDSHSVTDKPPEKQVTSGMDKGEWLSRGYLPHRDCTALTQHVCVHLAYLNAWAVMPGGKKAGTFADREIRVPGSGRLRIRRSALPGVDHPSVR